jgi:hypothetical protein
MVQNFGFIERAVTGERSSAVSETSETYAPAIDMESVVRHWPTGREVPSLIVELGSLMSGWEWGSIGTWQIGGQAFDEFWGNWCRGGAPLDGQFGIFMGFANGTQYAVWYRSSDPSGAHPVVDFGDEGDIRVLAPNIKAFYSKWAEGLGIGWLEPFDYEATPEQLAARHALGAKMLECITAIVTPPDGPPISEIEQALAATVANAQRVAEEYEKKRRLADVYGDRIDIDSTKKYWPGTHPIPLAIPKLGEYLKPLVNNAVGRCEMIGQRLPDNWIDHGTDLHEQFGFFLSDHRYRSVAIWYHEGAKEGCEPVVDFRGMVFDADDDVAVVAPNLKAYLTDWANAITSGDSDRGLMDDPEVAVQRPALAQGLRELAEELPEPTSSVPAPNLVVFIRTHITNERAKDLADPVLNEMANVLRLRYPSATDPLWVSIFAVFKDGAFEYSLTGQQLGDDSFPEGKALTPLLLQERAIRATGATAPLGPWNEAQIELFPDGRIALSGYWS